MEKSRLGISEFFEGYFKNFHRLLIVNLLFGLPLLLFYFIFYFINMLTGINSPFIYLPVIIFIFPFFAGVTLVTRNIAKKDKDISVLKLFIKGLKGNFLQFFVHGIIFCVVLFLCYSSLVLYWNLAQNSFIFYFFFGIALLISVGLLFMFYNIPVMTVSFELSLKDIYKNCFLMSFGEIKNNFFSTIGLALLSLVCFTIFIFATNPIVLLILMTIVMVLLVPSTASYIINFYVYKDMENIMLSKAGLKIESAEEILNRKIKDNNEKFAKEVLDFSNIDLDENKDGNEYLYFNGKMIKRSVLIEMKKKQERENG